MRFLKLYLMLYSVVASLFCVPYFGGYTIVSGRTFDWERESRLKVATETVE